MNHPVDNSRRRTLKLLASAPLLPLAGSLAGALGSSMAAAATSAVKSVNFIPMPAPSLLDPDAMATTTVNSQMVVNYANGSGQTFDLDYQPFFITGDEVENTEGGLTLADMVDVTTYHVGLRDHLDTFRKVWGERVSAPFPAWTAIEVMGFIIPGNYIEAKVVARLPKV